MAFTILSLCSGVGGLELGLRAAIPQSRVLAYVEREAFAASVLLARMEDQGLEPAPVWCGDLSELNWSAFTGQTDCITAGFPCQPWSVAGKRKGTDDERWIWDDIVAGIRIVRPRFVFLENVAGLVTGGGLPAVLRSLAEIGFDAEWTCIRASAVGAAHRRERFFLLAHCQGNGRRQGRAKSTGQQGRPYAAKRGGTMAHSAGERVRAPDTQTVSDSREISRASSTGGSGGLADACGEGLQGGELQEALRDGEGPGSHGPTAKFCQPLFAPGPSSEQWPAILELDPTLEPALCRDADGMAGRLDRLRVCGNGVVPLQAAVAFFELHKRLGEV